jgi:DNA repair exonuclease SbcCD ATPase subunit
MQAFKNTSPSDPNYIALAQTQKNIKDNLKTAEDSLYALSRRIPQIQSTVNQEVAGINNHIDQALENLGERRTAEATRNQQYAMTAMNNLALMLSEALDQLQNMMKKGKSGKGKGKQQSISQLSKMQQQLNQNMQKARDQLQQQGNQGKSQSGNNGGMSEQMARLARQQAMIRQALEQINKEENKDGRGGLGNLDKISKEMEQTEHDLVNKRITEEALKRQEQIQTRLLEAEKAEQEREQDQQRESHAGKETPPGYIKALQEYKQLKEKQTEQVRTVPPAINFYYKLKIKSYFELLNAK